MTKPCPSCARDMDIERSIGGEMCDGEPYLEASDTVIDGWTCMLCKRECCPECQPKSYLCEECSKPRPKENPEPAGELQPTHQHCVGCGGTYEVAGWFCRMCERSFCSRECPGVGLRVCKECGARLMDDLDALRWKDRVGKVGARARIHALLDKLTVDEAMDIVEERK